MPERLKEVQYVIFTLHGYGYTQAAKDNCSNKGEYMPEICRQIR